jgi:thiol-disulfide isomerase/thioredoxin
MRRIFGLISFFAFWGVLFITAPAQPPANKKQELVVFYSPGCHDCHKFKTETLPKLQAKFSRQLSFTWRNLEEIDNYKFLLALEERHKAVLKNTAPILFLEGYFLEAAGKPLDIVESFIQNSINTSLAQEKALHNIDLLERFRGFRPAVISAAGLIDGVNPCAFTVIVFFISFLALQGYRRKELIIIGGVFIASVFFTYLLVGIGLFGFLFSLKGFWVFMQAVNISIGIFSLVLGCLSLYDFFRFKQTHDSAGLLLQLPPAVKNQIHALIGLHYRKASSAAGSAVRETTFSKLVLSALVSGFLVSLLEAVCTGQTYLPTIVFVLKTTPYKLPAFLFLVIYNLMFILPLVAIFILALLGTTSGQFSRFLKTHLLKIKLLMAVLFFGLGLFLLWRA